MCYSTGWLLFLMKKNKAGNFTRDSDQVSVETMISRHDYYEEVLKIPSSPEWTLGNYMRQLHHGPSNTRLGVGYVQKVCTSQFYV